MPTEKFVHLTEQKKQALIDAAWQEFSNHEYDKVSVFQIAKNAHISRSNFYYYFSDKEDIYRYLLLSLRDQLIDQLKMKRDTYDIFELSVSIFEHIIEAKGTEKEKIYNRIMENMKPSTQNIFFSTSNHPCEKRPFASLVSDFANLRIESQEDLKVIIGMLAGSIALNIKYYFDNAATLDTIRHRFLQSMDFIKYGVIKTD